MEGDLSSDLLYTGHYLHAPSGLYLTWYRAYNPDTARWLSRDPIGEDGGINLYQYARNDPTKYIDLTGEEPSDSFEPDNAKHGGGHVDWYRNRKNIGRYRCDGTGIPFKGNMPPKIPNSLMDAFKKAASKLGKFCTLVSMSDLLNNATRSSTSDQLGEGGGEVLGD